MYKAIIIWSGPAGYTAAIKLAQWWMKVAIIENDLVGGICTNRWCTPSKAMIASAKHAHYVHEAYQYGINVWSVDINFSAIAERRDQVMADTREHIGWLLKHWNVDLIQGKGEIISKNQVKVWDQILDAENIIIATGSKPLIPGFLNKDDPSIINSNALISIKELPKELTIVWWWIIWLEFSTIFAHFGCKVRIIEFLDRVLANMDPEISAAITEKLQWYGIEILTGHKVLDISNGVIKAEVIASGEVKEIQSPMNLIAIGRQAVINASEYDAVWISHHPKWIHVNEYLQTSIPNIYAVGDSTGLSILAHVAIQQWLICAEHILWWSRGMNYDVIPAVVYTLPEVATVGTIPTDLSNIQVINFPFSANLRANIEWHNEGFVKLWIRDNILIACQMIGDYAGEIIQSYANLIQLWTPIDLIANTIHAHPTYNEIVRNSLEYALGRSIEYYK